MLLGFPKHFQPWFLMQVVILSCLSSRINILQGRQTERNAFFVYLMSIFETGKQIPTIFGYQFNTNYSVSLLINTNINFNYFKEELSISIPYQFFKKFPYQCQYQFMLSISPYDIVKITNFLSISHCYQCQYWYQLVN